MIFGLGIENDRLYSIGDDRSLKIWSISTGEILNDVYGHFGRPLALFVDAEWIITSDVEDICVWSHLSECKLFKKIPLAAGPIRSLLRFNDSLVSQFYCGYFFSFSSAFGFSSLKSVKRPPTRSSSSKSYKFMLENHNCVLDLI